MEPDALFPFGGAEDPEHLPLGGELEVPLRLGGALVVDGPLRADRVEGEGPLRGDAPLHRVDVEGGFLGAVDLDRPAVVDRPVLRVNPGRVPAQLRLGAGR